MKHIKYNLEHYIKQKEANVDIDHDFKERLYFQLSKEKVKKPKKYWWRFSLPTLALAGSAIAIIIYFSSSSSVEKLVNTAFIPQVALAEALQKSMNLESFDQTLGLPDDGQLHHRKVVFTYNYQYPNEAELGSGNNIINIWSDGNNLRSDEQRDVTMPNRASDSTSFIVSTRDNLSCSINSAISCQKITDEQQDFNSIIDGEHSWFSPKINEVLVSDFTATPFTDEDGYPGTVFSWSTKKPMVNGMFQVYSMVSASGSGGSVDTVDKDDGKYWYEFTMFSDAQLNNNDLYIQITDNEPFDPDLKDEVVIEASSIYILKNGTNELNPLSSSEFLEVGQQLNVGDSVLGKNGYTMATEPLLYMLRNPSKLAEPLTANNVLFNDQLVDSVTYTLPLDYLFQTSLVLGAALDHENQYYVHFYLDPADHSKLLGYSITLLDEMIVNMQFTDEVLNKDQTDLIFDVRTWKELYQ